MHTTIYIYIFILVVLCMYIYSYYKHPTNISISQTSLQNFKFDMVLTRLPVVIHDNTPNMVDLIHTTWFKFNVSSRFQMKDVAPAWHTNKYKYVLFEAENDGEILLYPACKPRTKEKNPYPDEGVIAIQATKGQVVIVPFKWMYLIPATMAVKCIGIHDMITYFLP